QVTAIGGDILVGKGQRPHQQSAGVLGGQAVQLLLVYVVVVGEAHGQVVVVLIEGKALDGVVIGPAGHRLLCKAVLLVLGHDGEPHAEQPPQLVVIGFGVAAHVRGKAQGGIQVQDAGGHRAVEELHTALVHPEAEVVVGVVGVHPPVPFGELLFQGDGR